MEKFTLERDGQIDFYNTFLPRVNPVLTVEDILNDNNDGVLNGNLLEFKLHVSDLSAVLFQCIKYLSALRIKGKPVPANIVIVDLNNSVAWLYHSALYLEAIERPYSGGASKDNGGFVGERPAARLNYSRPTDANKLVGILKECNFTPINIDENCIVGWASSFYREVPTARKEDFLGDNTGKHKTRGEIRCPSHFKKYILPYRGKSNVKFSYLMDRLNDTLQKKNLGAFYTHYLYARKSLELVRAAIARVPKGNDYIILDRCAGTGNLEAELTDEELSHCIVSTVEYYEYKVLQELLGAKVRAIIPPVETADTFNAGLVTGADALSGEYIENPIIKQFVGNPKCTIILFENPPYAETTSIEHQKRGAGAKSSSWKQSYVVQEMKKEVKGTVSNDLGNAFIWSGFKYFLRQPTDSYVVYSPVKYWKAQHLINKKFLKGFAFNRRHFHTNIDACIMCALWSNESSRQDEFKIEGFDIENEKLVSFDMLSVRRIHSSYSEVYYDKKKYDDTADGVLLDFDGTEIDADRSSVRQRPFFNKNMVGYLAVKGANFDNPDASVHLLRTGEYDGNGFYLRTTNYLRSLPMFCASRYITYNREWTERARIMKSADGSVKYNRDVSNGKLGQFLLKSLLFTCVEMQNHCRTFKGSDGRLYRNELCLDGTNGKTIALSALRALKRGKKEQGILKQWQTVLRWAKMADGYNAKLTYGVYQIFAELDTSHIDEESGERVFDNVELHTALKDLRELTKNYYNSEIVPVLFKYEFIK